MPAEHEALVQEIIDAHRGIEGAALPILHAVQEALGCVPEAVIPLIAKGAEHHPRRDARHCDLLSRFPARAGRAACAEALPRRGVPVDGRACRRRSHQAAARHRFRRDLRRRARDARRGLLPWPLRDRALRDARRKGDRPARSRRRRSHRRGGATGDRASSSPAMPARSRSAPMRSRPRSRVSRSNVRRASRSSATARAALYWLEPMVEVETPAGRIAYGPVKPSDVASLFEAGFPRRRAASSLARPDRRNPLPEAADAPDLRALRHRRSALARRLSRAWRHEGAGARRRRCSRSRSSRR